MGRSCWRRCCAVRAAPGGYGGCCDQSNGCPCQGPAGLPWPIASPVGRWRSLHLSPPTGRSETKAGQARGRRMCRFVCEFAHRSSSCPTDPGAAHGICRSGPAVPCWQQSRLGACTRISARGEWVSVSGKPPSSALVSGTGQGDPELEDGPIGGQGEHLAARAEDRSPGQLSAEPGYSAISRCDAPPRPR
jgi:hypothetical protein